MATAVLVTAAPVMSMETAAWALLLPGCLVSAGIALWSIRRARRVRVGEYAIPAAIALAALVIALLPGVLRDTEGPVGIAIYDALWYVQGTDWLQDHTTQAVPAGDASRYDLTEVYGHAVVSRDQRLGVFALNAAAATLFRATADETLFAFLGALFAVLPLALWALARGLGSDRTGATVAAVFGLSPAILLLVGDSALVNLAGLVLAPPALYFCTRWITRRRWGDLLVAAVLVGGLVASFPEFVLPVLIIGALGLLVLGVSEGRTDGRRWIRATAPRLLALGAAVTAVAPVAVVRAWGYLIDIGVTVVGQPPRFLTAENGWAWAFGALHLYQLPRFDLLSSERKVVAIGLPILLALILAVGIVKAGLRRGVFVAIPIAVAILLGGLAYTRYQDGDCEYCLWKSMTLILPFIAIGLALGATAIRGLVLPPRWRFATLLALGIVLVAGVASVAWSDRRLVQAMYYAPAVVSSDLREVASSAEIPRRSEVLVEAPDASSAPGFSTPAMYLLARSISDARVSFVARERAAAYLGVGGETGEQFYSPTYEYVLTPFSSLVSNREFVRREGSYGLLARAPIDVTIVGAGAALDPSEGPGAIPWVASPFQLWLSSPHYTGPAQLNFTLVRPRGDSLGFSADGASLVAARSGDGNRLCVEVPIQSPLTKVEVTPVLTAPIAIALRATESDPVPAPPKVLGIASMAATPGECAQGADIRFRNGWERAEELGGGSVGRWMGTSATIVVTDSRLEKQGLVLSARVTSLVVPRSLSMEVQGASTTFEVPGGFTWREILVPLPSGSDRIVVTLIATPPAQSASTVTPGDMRNVAIMFSDVTVDAPSS